MMVHYPLIVNTWSLFRGKPWSKEAVASGGNKGQDGGTQTLKLDDNQGGIVKVQLWWIL